MRLSGEEQTTHWGLLSPSSVRKQVVNIPSFVVRLDSQKHIDFSLRSPYGGGRPGRVKRKNAKKGQGGAGGADEEEEDWNGGWLVWHFVFFNNKNIWPNLSDHFYLVCGGNYAC